jgi:hypothetical protein
MSGFSQNETRIRIGAALLLGILLVIGFWLRVRNLGNLGLVVDEGNQVLAVQGILKHGIPKVDTGFVYSRGLPFLYAEVAAAKVFGLNEFSLRLPAVLFGVAAILASYFLGKAVFSRPVGLLTALVMTFSVWEIEMSRYARFYTAFQLMYLVSLFCFYKGFMLGVRPYKFAFVAAAFITFSFHELGVMLATCFLIPLFSSAYSPHRKWAFGASAAGLAGLWAFYPKLLGPLKAMADPIPHAAGEGAAVRPLGGLMAIVKNRFYLPNVAFLLEAVREHPLMLLLPAFLTGAATAYLIYRFLRKEDGWRAPFAIVLVWAAFVHQFGLLAILLLVYLALFAEKLADLAEPALMTVYAVVPFCLAFWIPVLLESSARRISVTRVLLDYPNVYRYFLQWFVNGWPVLTILLFLGCSVLAARFISDRTAPAPLFALGALFVPIVLTSFLRNEFYEARYLFHLYPLMVVVFCMVVVEAGSRILGRFQMRGYGQTLAVVVLSALTLFISQDANPADAWAIGDRTYRSAKDPIKGHVNWASYATFHQDHKTPSLYVRERLRPGDRVIAVGAPHMIAVYHYYVGRVDYSVAEKVENFQLRLEDRRIVDRMTGSKVLDSLSRLSETLAGSPGEGIWLLCDRMLLAVDNHYLSRPMKEYLGSLTRDPDYVGLDGLTLAVKIR